MHNSLYCIKYKKNSHIMILICICDIIYFYFLLSLIYNILTMNFNGKQNYTSKNKTWMILKDTRWLSLIFKQRRKNVASFTKTEYLDEFWISPIIQKHNLYIYVTEPETNYSKHKPFLISSFIYLFYFSQHFYGGGPLVSVSFYKEQYQSGYLNVCSIVIFTHFFGQ